MRHLERGATYRPIFVAAGILLLLLILRTPLFSSAMQRNLVFLRLNHMTPLAWSASDTGGIRSLLERALQQGASPKSAWRMAGLLALSEGEREDAMRAFSHSDTDGADLVWWGQQRERTGAVADAGHLYRSAAQLEPDLADAWYRAGQLELVHGDILTAASSLERALAAARRDKVGLSDVYLALGNAQRQLGTRRSVVTETYIAALEIDDFRDARGKRDTYYQLGELALWDMQDASAAVSFYQEAVTVAPEDQWAHLRLGYALYRSTGDVTAAEEEISYALALWPDEKYLKWPYFYLGEIYADAGLAEKAIAAYEQVLALDPGDQRVRERLAYLRNE